MELFDLILGMRWTFLPMWLLSRVCLDSRHDTRTWTLSSSESRQRANTVPWNTRSLYCIHSCCRQCSCLYNMNTCMLLNMRSLCCIHSSGSCLYNMNTCICKIQCPGIWGLYTVSTRVVVNVPVCIIWIPVSVKYSALEHEVSIVYPLVWL